MTTTPVEARCRRHPVIRNVADALGWETPTDADEALDDQRTLLTELASRWHRVDHPRRVRRSWRRPSAALATLEAA